MWRFRADGERDNNNNNKSTDESAKSCQMKQQLKEKIGNDWVAETKLIQSRKNLPSDRVDWTEACALNATKWIEQRKSKQKKNIEQKKNTKLNEHI